LFSGGAGSIGAERFAGEEHFRALLKCGEMNHETDEKNEKRQGKSNGLRRNSERSWFSGRAHLAASKRLFPIPFRYFRVFRG
jgi:hypothetical protein